MLNLPISTHYFNGTTKHMSQIEDVINENLSIRWLLEIIIISLFIICYVSIIMSIFSCIVCIRLKKRGRVTPINSI